MALISPTQQITLNAGDGIEIDENQPNRDFTIANLHRYVPGIYMTSIVESPVNTFTFNVPRIPDYEFFPGTNMTSIVQGPLDKFTFNNPTYTFVAGTNMTSIVPSFPYTWTFNVKERFQVLYVKLIGVAANITVSQYVFPIGTVSFSRTYTQSNYWLPHDGVLRNFRMKSVGLDANDIIGVEVHVNGVNAGPQYYIDQAQPESYNNGDDFPVSENDTFSYFLLQITGNPFSVTRAVEISMDYYF